MRISFHCKVFRLNLIFIALMAVACPFATRADDQVVFKETFTDNAAGWTAQGSLSVVHDPAAGEQDGGLVLSFPAALTPMNGALAADSLASGGAFMRDYRAMMNPQLRFSVFFETKPPSLFYVMLGDGESTAVHYIATEGLASNRWHQVIISLTDATDWDFASLADFERLLSSSTSLTWNLFNAGINGETYRLDYVELVEAGSNQGQDDGVEQGAEVYDAAGDGTNLDGDGGEEGNEIEVDEGSGGGDISGGHQADEDVDHDEGSGPGGTTDGEVEQDDRTEVPLVVQPTNGAIVEARQPLFSWQVVDSSEWYRIQLSRDGVTYRQNWVEGSTRWQPLEPLVSGSYSWRVQGWSEGTGYTAWSDSYTFSIPATGNHAVQPITPVTQQISPDIVYRWSALASAGWYQLHVEREGFGSWHNAWHVNDSPFDARALITEHPPGTYRWRVRSWSTNNMGPWSETISFTVEHQVDLRYFLPSVTTNAYGKVIRKPYTPRTAAHP